jgi:hypothetical protein
MSESEMQAELERLRAENAQLKSKDKGGLTLKVSEKGGVSLYGIGRFPVIRARNGHCFSRNNLFKITAHSPERRVATASARTRTLRESNKRR